MDGPSDPHPQWQVDVRIGLANTVLGGVSVALGHLLRGERPGWRELAWGAAGGALVYGGKRVAAEQFTGSGLLARQVSGLGSAVVWNVGHGLDPFARVQLAVGPARLRLESGAGPVLAVDMATLISAAYFKLANGGAILDWSRTLSSGALVFHSRTLGRYGSSGGGAILLPGDPLRYDERLLLAHEVIHVIQRDQLSLQATSGIDHWLVSLLIAPAAAPHLHLGLENLVLGAMDFIPYDRRPWEVEAYEITGQELGLREVAR